MKNNAAIKLENVEVDASGKISDEIKKKYGEKEVMDFPDVVF